MFEMKSALHVTAMLWCLSLLASCQTMESVSEDLTSNSYGISCSTELGSYALPVSRIKLSIYQSFEKGTQHKVGAPVLQLFDPVPRADEKHRFCLNFLDQGLSDDDVTVKFAGSYTTKKADTSTATPKTDHSDAGLLGLVVSKNIDRTGEIIQDLLRAFFVLRSGDPSFRPRAEPTLVSREIYSDEVQPFSLEVMAALNERIRQFGFCITLGPYTHDPELLPVDRYCNQPHLSALREFMSAHADGYRSQRYFVPRNRLPPALYYRPRQPHKIYVYVNRDPESETTWELREIRTVKLENASPIIGLNVARVPFAEARVVFGFDRGDLSAVCLAKGSSFRGAIEIPLDIVYGIVRLPSQAIVANVNEITSRGTLLAKQKQVIEAQNNYLTIKAQGGASSGTGNNAQVLAAGTTPGFGTPNPNPAVSTVGTANFPDYCDRINTSLGSL